MLTNISMFLAGLEFVYVLFRLSKARRGNREQEKERLRRR